jgi:S1-C subfamily serine protease
MDERPSAAQRPVWGTPVGFATVVFVLTAAAAWAALQLLRADAGEPGGGVAEPRDPLEDEQPRAVGPESPLTSAEERRVAMFAQAARSVVHIRARRRDALPADDVPGRVALDPLQVAPGMGTGIVWSERGYIVTNAHLVDGRNDIVVTLVDGTEWQADYVGHVPEADLAVLAIGAPRSMLKVAQLGTSADLRVGQDALAIGNPFGLDHTLSAGVVSGLGRRVNSYGRVLDGLIQTDTAINPGNSGGPLLNSGGQVVGITTAIHSAGLETPVNIGIGFAIPIDTVNEVVPALIARGIEPWYELGMYVAPDWQSEKIVGAFGVRGVLPLEVVPGGPADQAGIRGVGTNSSFIRVGELIVGVEGEPVADRATFDRLVHARRGRPTLGLDVLRRQADMQDREVVQVVLAPRW